MTSLRAARANAATELRLAASLRRDLAAGEFRPSQREAALSAHRDHLRHARWCNAYAALLALR
jgi:hypothetical protein